jgi:hypothetical protein
VSKIGGFGHSISNLMQADFKNPTSKGELCATKTGPSPDSKFANAKNSLTAAPTFGARLSGGPTQIEQLFFHDHICLDHQEAYGNLP